MVCRPGVGSRDRFAGLLITAGSGREEQSCNILPRIIAINRSAAATRAIEQCGIESVLVHDGVFM